MLVCGTAIRISEEGAEEENIIMRRALPLSCAAQYLGTVPRYLRSEKALSFAVERDAKRAAAEKSRPPQDGPGGGPRPERERMRVDLRAPRGGRGGGFSPGGGGRGGGFSPGGGGRGRGGYQHSGGQQQKPMWPCSCGKRNYENRTTCFACSAPKSPDAVAS